MKSRILFGRALAARSVIDNMQAKTRLPACLAALAAVLGLASCQTPLAGPAAIITYHQVGACNVAGDATPAANQAFVIFAIDKIDNTQSGINFNFDPTKLYTNSGAADPIDPQVPATQQILGGQQIGPATISAGNTHYFGNSPFGMAEVATTAANGAAEANNVNYNLNYNTGTADPPILLQKLNLGRTIWPDTPHCSDINLGTGSFVYALAPTENSVIVPASINAQTGSLTVGTNATTPGSNTIALDPSSRYLYAVNSASISTFKIDQSTGNLTKFGGDVGAAFDSGGAAVDPSDSYLFVTSNSEHTVRTYKIAQPAGGALTLIDTTPLPAGNSPEAVTVDPSGRFLYTLNSSYPIGTSITAFQIANANAAKPGFLTNVGTTTLPQGFTGQAIEASQGGQYVYAAAAYGPVAGFSINQQTGTLTPLTALGSPWNAGKNPLGLETDPYGAYLYVGNQAISGFPTNTMEVFSIAEPSGGLTPLQSFDLQQFGLAVFDGFAVDRTGSFLYELQGYNSTEGAIDGYAISPTKGTLTNLGSTNISGGAFYAGGSTNQTVIAATGTIE